MNRKILAFLVCGISVSTYVSPTSAGFDCTLVQPEVCLGECPTAGSVCTFDSQANECLCEPSGACCNFDPVVAGGPSISCTETTEIECLDEGGVFREGATCDDDPCGCPGGGGDCCEPNDTPGCDDVECCELVCACDDFCCTNAWDSACAGPNSFVPGCSALDLCEQCMLPPCGEAEAPACNGSCDPGETCVEDDRLTAGGGGCICVPEGPTGACCLVTLVAGDKGDPAENCIDTTRDECDSIFGNYKGDGTSCEDQPNPCQGACCVEEPDTAGIGGCFITDDFSCALFFEGSYLGDGTTCEPDPCVACGDSEAPTCGGFCRPGFVCEESSGPMTAGIDECACMPERGACCLIFDLVVAGALPCEVMDRFLCEKSGGDFKGHGTTCEPNPCVGACCALPITAGVNGIIGCEVTTERECTDFIFNGDYQGDGTTCDPDPCLPRCEDSEFPACGGICPEGETCIASEDFVAAGVEADCRCVPLGACCLLNGDCEERPEDECEGEFGGVGTTCAGVTCARPRVSPTQKGSLLYFSKIEIKWDAAGNLIQDTFVDISNDYPQGVNVQGYFINGDIEVPELTDDDPGGPRGFEPGWNTADCRFTLTANQPHFWSAANGSDKCQPFTVLDDDGPGRLDPEANDGSRILRGFAIFFAVDFFTFDTVGGPFSGWLPIRWNHLKGDAVLVNYANKTAWEYNAWAFRLFGPPQGCPEPTIGITGCDPIEPVGADAPPAALLVDFYASGSTALSGGNQTVMVDTDLTLHAVSLDLRQDGCGPVLTKVEAEIWNEFESKFSGTRRCICCWDQTMLSAWSRSDAIPNHFMRQTLGTDKGMARLTGVASFECDYLTFCGPTAFQKRAECEQLNFFDRLPLPFGGEDAAILGLATKFLSFTPSNKKDTAGMNLVGMGEQGAFIIIDLQLGPEEFHTGRTSAMQRDGSSTPKGATAQTGPTMTIELGNGSSERMPSIKQKESRQRGSLRR